MQVIEDLNAITMIDGKPLEAVITEGMRHPNIVNTLAHTVQHAPARPQPQPRTHDSAHSTLHSSPGTSTTPRKAPKGLQSEGVAWLLLEYCDMGCLQVLAPPTHLCPSPVRTTACHFPHSSGRPCALTREWEALHHAALPLTLVSCSEPSGLYVTQ